MRLIEIQSKEDEFANALKGYFTVSQLIDFLLTHEVQYAGRDVNLVESIAKYVKSLGFDSRLGFTDTFSGNSSIRHQGVFIYDNDMLVTEIVHGDMTKGYFVPILFRDYPNKIKETVYFKSYEDKVIVKYNNKSIVRKK